ncbi:hypothetical protein COLSTE_00005 [Collinsella stercoris DSM 13279]|uniref:Uncharacterized protein n=1 Tax=Collinsella stercoris DSM 13279 TaxID=445975 RepID=B6G7G6_9ACTN|nr:hypothetical protein COLSTE_00005 [Collinsella stercoris DSM 13279]
MAPTIPLTARRARADAPPRAAGDRRAAPGGRRVPPGGVVMRIRR